MKHNTRLFFAAVFCLLAAVACNKPEDLGPEMLEIDKQELNFDVQGGTQTITLASTVDWGIKNYTPDVQKWLSINPSKGKGSKAEQIITITALANEGKIRSAELEFFGNILCKSSLSVKQASDIASGLGTAESPYSPAEANAKCVEIGSTASTQDYYVKGIVVEVVECSAQFGNAEFYITEDGVATSERFYVYRMRYFGGAKMPSDDAIKVGDEVIVKGKLVNYKGDTPELAQGGELVSLNGETSGGTVVTPDYQNAPAKTVQEFITAADPNTYYKLTGTVSNFNSQYCNFDIKDASGSVYVYSVENKSEWSTKIKDGDTVTLAGKYLWYEHKTDPAKNKHEVVEAYIISVEGGAAGETPDYENAPAKTVAEFIAAADENTYYKLTGKISNYNATACRFDLTDASGTILVYKVDNADTYKAILKSGYTVTLAGKYKLYETTKEVDPAYILSYEAGEAPAVELTHPLTSNVTWAAGTDASNAQVVINGGSNNAIKLGVTSRIGTATLTIPASATKLSFYAIGWNGKVGKVEIVNAGTVVQTITANPNPGANNSSPFTIETLSDTDDYFEVPITAGTTSLTIRTTSAGFRAILFGINAQQI